jgi:hypothetical protein
MWQAREVLGRSLTGISILERVRLGLGIARKERLRRLECPTVEEPHQEVKVIQEPPKVGGQDGRVLWF